jgi:hypothetical protein
MFVDRLRMQSRLAQGMDLNLLNKSYRYGAQRWENMNSKDVSFVGGRDFFFGLLVLYQAPRG